MGILVFSVYKPERRRYGSQASNFVSLYNIYIMGIMCLLEWSLHGWEPLEKLIGSLWNVHDSMDLHDLLSILQFKSVWQFFQFLVMVKIMTELWLWRENGLMDDEL